MGATKKRRSSKHRGNAAGMIESRGRTGARLAGEPAPGTKGGGPRVPTEPSWGKSAKKALIPVAILLPILFLTQKNVSVVSVLLLASMAYLLYVPLAFYTDKWVYNRFVNKK